MKIKNRNKLLLFSVVAACLNGVFVGSMSASVFATSSLSVTIVNTISLDIMPKTAAGTFTHSSTSDNTVSVSTDNYTGYTLGIAASTANDNALSYKENNTIVDNINSHNVSAGVSETNYANDSYASSNNLNNTWGYRPSKYNSEDNTTTNLYYPAPTSTTILDTTSVANPTTSNNYNIAIGARVGLDKTPGAYTNTFVITVVANPTPYTITYDVNGGTNAPANESSSSYTDAVNISSTIPAKTNYTFLGWCKGTSSASNITTTAGVDSCNTTVYSPNGDGTNLSLTIDQTSSSNDIYLYAMWGLNSYTVTVNFAGSGVSSVSFTNATYGNANTVSSTGGTTSLKHGVPYTITMNFSSSSYTIDSWTTTANGTLNSTTANPTTYTVTNTATLTATGKTNKLYFQDATSANCGSTMYDNRGNDTYKNIAYTTATIDSLCWMTRNLDLPGGTTLSQSDSNLNGSTTSYTLRASSTSGFNDYTTGWVYNSSSTYNDTSCGNNNPCYSYYSYVAATAGTNPSSGEASSDICPKGWRLPTRAELNTLYSSYNTGAKLVAAPFLGVYAGYYDDSSFYDSGSGGYYWSSSANSASFACNLRFSSSSVSVGNYAKRYGRSVRCVAKS